MDTESHVDVRIHGAEPRVFLEVACKLSGGRHLFEYHLRTNTWLCPDCGCRAKWEPGGEFRGPGPYGNYKFWIPE